MAQRVEVILEDDLTGGEADETVRYSLDGVDYEVDLTAENARQLREDLARWVAVSRRAGGRAKRGTAKRSSAGETAKMRAWLRSHGHAVSDRGRIPGELRDLYTAAN